MIKQVWIGGTQGGYRPALFDTGSDVTLVDANTARELGLQFTRQVIQLKGLFGGDAVGYEALATIYVPEANIKVSTNVYVPDVPISSIIIGRDLMRRAKLRMEFPNGERVSSEFSSPQAAPQQQSVQSNPAISTVGAIIVGSLALVGVFAILDWAFGGNKTKRRKQF